MHIKKKAFLSKSTIALTVALIILFGGLWISVDYFFLSNQSDAKGNYHSAEPSSSSQNDKEMRLENLHSHAAVLLRLDDNKVIFEREGDQKIYPASMTKIMTAIVALEKIPDLNTKIEIPASIFPELQRANASMAGFRPGEVVPLIDVIYGILLPSGAEASVGLAVWLTGSEENYVQLMNQKAKEIGMKSTNFTNVCGLHHAQHYSTVKDIAVLMEYAMQNTTFRTIAATASHTTAGTSMHPYGITFKSTLFGRVDSLEFDGGVILGGKTGFTDEAGLCLASFAEKNGVEYVLVTAGAEGNNRSKPYHILDALEVYATIQ